MNAQKFWRYNELRRTDDWTIRLTWNDTHPWLTFKLNLSKAPYTFWILCGTAITQCEQISNAPLEPDAADELMKVYLAKGVLATTAIEGNTLTEEEVRRRIDGNLTLPPSREYLGIEVDNIIRASSAILAAKVEGKDTQLTPRQIAAMNGEVLKGLKLEPDVVAGKVRDYSVGVADYRGAPAKDLDNLLQRLCDWLNEDWIGSPEGLPEADRFRLDAMLKAVMAHLYLAWIHPFGDGNGRTARLVEFHTLVRGGVPFPAAHLLSNFYNETRAEYYRQLRYASKSGGDVFPFLHYAIQGFVDQLRAQLAVIREQQLDLFWRNYVHQTLGDSETGRRRRYLVLDLTSHREPVPRKKLIDLSTRVLRHYIAKGEKTILRDLAELEKLRLVVREGDAYRVNRDIVLSYTAPTRHAKK